MSNLVPVSWRDSVEELRDRVTGVFDRWLHPQSQYVAADRRDGRPGALLGAGMPAVNIEESDDEVTVTAELPGLDRKDFHVELDRQRLILRGEKQLARSKKRRNYYYSERFHGAFYRVIQLPCEVDGDKVRATCKRGLLQVRIPKSEAAKARSTRVTVN